MKKTTLRKQKEQLERKKSILKAAREAFFEKGFMATTMDAVADGCDLAKGTIYLYFKSKEELYVSIMAEGMALLRKDFEKIVDLPLPANGLLGEVLQTYFSFYQTNRKYFRIMFLSSQPDLRERVPDELLKECMNSARDCMQILSDIIEKGIETGVFRKLNPWAAANILWSTVNGIIMHYEQGPLYRDEILRLELEEMLRQALDVALNGLEVRKNDG
jgi:AcrR family transcriptional regulator